MSVKDRLQIVIVTYNRDIYLDRTLHFLTDEGSPVRDFDICILDNNSDDNTDNVIKSFQEKFPNIEHVKHIHNIGANANIARAFEINTKDYVWVLGDSYLYDWTNWEEIEKAIDNNESVIVATRDAIPDDNKTTAAVLSESCFLSTCIYSKTLFDGIVFKLIYDSIYTLFPHIVPLVNYVNNGGKFYIPDKGVVRHGAWTSEGATGRYFGWYRDFNASSFYPKVETMCSITGMSLVFSILKDKKLLDDVLECEYEVWRKLSGYNIKNPYKLQVQMYAKNKDLSQLADLYLYLKSKHCRNIDQYIMAQFPLYKLLLNPFFRFWHSKHTVKYYYYRVLTNLTFGDKREYFRNKKYKYKNLVY